MVDNEYQVMNPTNKMQWDDFKFCFLFGSIPPHCCIYLWFIAVLCKRITTNSESCKLYIETSDGEFSLAQFRKTVTSNHDIWWDNTNTQPFIDQLTWIAFDLYLSLHIIKRSYLWNHEFSNLGYKRIAMKMTIFLYFLFSIVTIEYSCLGSERTWTKKKFIFFIICFPFLSFCG